MPGKNAQCSVEIFAVLGDRLKDGGISIRNKETTERLTNHQRRSVSRMTGVPA